MTLTTTNDFNSQLAEMDRVYEVCKKLMSTPHYQKLGEAGIHAIMAKSKALGVNLFDALNGGFYCINGKVGMSTELMAALVRQRGHNIVQVESTNNVCVLKGKRADNGDEWTCSFNDQDAIAAGLWNGPTWRKYPRTMLYNRCMSMLFRQLFADLSLGAGYVKDEIDEITKTGDYASNLPVAESEEVKTPDEPKVVEKPTLEQVNKLTSILGDCSQEYKDLVLGRIASKGWNGIADMPKDAYSNLLTQALMKRAENIGALTTVEKQQQVDE